MSSQSCVSVLRFQHRQFSSSEVESPSHAGLVRPSSFMTWGALGHFRSRCQRLGRTACSQQTSDASTSAAHEYGEDPALHEQPVRKPMIESLIMPSISRFITHQIMSCQESVDVGTAAKWPDLILANLEPVLVPVAFVLQQTSACPEGCL